MQNYADAVNETKLMLNNVIQELEQRKQMTVKNAINILKNVKNTGETSKIKLQTSILTNVVQNSYIQQVAKRKIEKQLERVLELYIQYEQEYAQLSSQQENIEQAKQTSKPKIQMTPQLKQRFEQFTERLNSDLREDQPGKTEILEKINNVLEQLQISNKLQEEQNQLIKSLTDAIQGQDSSELQKAYTMQQKLLLQYQKAFELGETDF